MGYRPNAMAAGLAQFRRASKSVPVRAALAWLNCWPNPCDLRGYKEFNSYWLGAARTAENLGYHLEEFTIGGRLTLQRTEKALLTRGINGILIPPHPAGVKWEDFHWELFSAVRFGRSVVYPRVHVVTSNQVSNTILACQMIRKNGYRRIGFMMNDSEIPRGILIKAGFLMDQSTLPDRHRIPLLPIQNAAPYKQSLTALRSWLRKHKPDSIFTDSPKARQMLTDLGYRVPDDIGLAVYSVLDGDADAGIFQNSEEIGRVGINVLLSLINDNDHGVPPIFREILVDGTWVDGSTLPKRV
jgi:DNA-binding LacI/PurR family transcriptional regulator